MVPWLIWTGGGRGKGRSWKSLKVKLGSGLMRWISSGRKSSALVVVRGSA